VIVTADHGISFQGGEVYRRIAEPQNMGGVANPPLFIKYPGQTKGKTSPTHTQTIDIVPTIAQELGIENLYKTQGKPISEDGRGGEVAVTNGQGEVIRMPLSRVLRQRNAVVKQGFFRLGKGDLFHLGPAPELIGTAAPALSVGIRPGTSATVENGDALEHVNPRAQEVPAFIAGEADGVKAGTVIAIAVNGTVEATGRTFLLGGELHYGAVVPPSSFSPGRNQIGVYEVGAGNTLTPLGGN
jgi:hypothetical protein